MSIRQSTRTQVLLAFDLCHSAGFGEARAAPWRESGIASSNPVTTPGQHSTRDVCGHIKLITVTGNIESSAQPDCYTQQFVRGAFALWSSEEIWQAHNTEPGVTDVFGTWQNVFDVDECALMEPYLGTNSHSL